MVFKGLDAAGNGCSWVRAQGINGRVREDSQRIPESTEQEGKFCHAGGNMPATLRGRDAKRAGGWFVDDRCVALRHNRRVDGRRMNEADAMVWAQELARKTREVCAHFPEADPENVRHTLILLQMPPEERLARSLLRGGARAKHK